MLLCQELLLSTSTNCSPWLATRTRNQVSSVHRTSARRKTPRDGAPGAPGARGARARDGGS